ncbi:MAG: NUDIX domain-containing protein [Phycisphaeraceae bacterium]|nr:NUDIX domain-containing protein [Phycisphaeraceae bacterium]
MPTLRTDIVDVYVFRRGPGLEFLQLRRTDGAYAGSWQPVMGHVEPGERAAACARRELLEETGLDAAGAHALGFWALQAVRPYFIPALDCVMLSARFAVEAAPGWAPVLCAEHDAHRWVAGAEAFVWQGQRETCGEIGALLDALARGGEGAAYLGAGLRIEG